MKKQFWFFAPTYDKKAITKVIEAWAHAIVTDKKEIADKIHKLANIDVIAPSGWDKELDKDVQRVTITKKEDEDIVVWYKWKTTIISNKDWTIIPLENLLSKTTNLIQTVTTAEQAKLALTTMEKGADGICLETDDIEEIIQTWKVFRASTQEQITLKEAKIVSKKNVWLADRCCIDTCSVLEPWVGMLAGNSSAGMLLVFNENVQSPYCDPRPFRVNAGAVHAYIKCPDNKTKYMGELTSGDEVLVVDPHWQMQTVTVGRNKIEKRPMMMITFAIDDQEYTHILQNAETIRLTTPDGQPISITHLNTGDTVLWYVEDAWRHFGVQVSETITEK